MGGKIIAADPDRVEAEIEKLWLDLRCVHRSGKPVRKQCNCSLRRLCWSDDAEPHFRFEFLIPKNLSYRRNIRQRVNTLERCCSKRPHRACIQLLDLVRIVPEHCRNMPPEKSIDRWRATLIGYIGDIDICHVPKLFNADVLCGGRPCACER